MSDLFYHAVRQMARPIWVVATRPVVLHRERIPAKGPVLLASNHTSPYDIPCLIATARRPLDFMSITELFRNPVGRWFFNGMNTFALNRSRKDPATVRTVLQRLQRGRAVAMFPEGRICRPDQSVLAGGPIRTGVARMARLSGAPIVPCVLLGTGIFARPTAWLPLRRTRYAVAFGEAITMPAGDDREAAEIRAIERLLAAYRALYQELSAASGLDIHSQVWRTPPAGPAPVA